MRVQRGEGYRLGAVAGFRQITDLHAGRHLYVDDLSMPPPFSKAR